MCEDDISNSSVVQITQMELSVKLPRNQCEFLRSYCDGPSEKHFSSRRPDSKIIDAAPCQFLNSRY